jgi:hypothetical protein
MLRTGLRLILAVVFLAFSVMCFCEMRLAAMPLGVIFLLFSLYSLRLTLKGEDI